MDVMYWLVRHPLTLSFMQYSNSTLTYQNRDMLGHAHTGFTQIVALVCIKGIVQHLGTMLTGYNDKS